MTRGHPCPSRQLSGAAEEGDVRKLRQQDVATDLSQPRDRTKELVLLTKRLVLGDQRVDAFASGFEFLLGELDAALERLSKSSIF